MHPVKAWYRRNFSDPQVINLVLLLLAGFVVVYLFGRMLVPFFASLIIAYLLDGVVRLLERRGMPRLAAILLVFFCFMALLLLFFFWFIPLLIAQVTQLFQQLPVMVSEAQRALLQLPERYPRLISEEQIREIFGVLRTELGRLGQIVLTVSLASVMGLITLLIYLVLVPFLVFFFLKDKDFLIAWLLDFIPPERQLARQVWEEVHTQIGNFIRGKLIEIAIVWGVTFAVFSWLGLQYSMLLGLLIGLSVLVPYVGAAVATLPVALVAYFQWGFGGEFITVLIAYAIIQAIDGNLLAPLLFAGVVHLHPVAIIAAILIFGGLWGFWGVFFAIPLAALIKAVLQTWPRQGGRPPAAAGETREAP